MDLVAANTRLSGCCGIDHLVDDKFDGGVFDAHGEPHRAVQQYSSCSRVPHVSAGSGRCVLVALCEGARH